MIAKLVSGLLAVPAAAVWLSAQPAGAASPRKPVRPPSVPIAAVDPYFSVWSPADCLTDAETCHWTGAEHRLTLMARIDGKPWRFAGASPADVPAMKQTGRTVTPTRSLYTFEAAGVVLSVTFLTPLLLDDLDLLSRPVSYIEVEARSADGAAHDVAVLGAVTGVWAVHSPEQEVTWQTYRTREARPLVGAKIGTTAQPVLERAGDQIRIDWGYLHLAFRDEPGVSLVVTTVEDAVSRFTTAGTLEGVASLAPPRAAEGTAMACSLPMGRVGRRPVSRLIALAYDDLYSVEYFHRKLRPYWRRGGADALSVISEGIEQYPAVRKRCEAFDRELLNDARRAGGDDYADIVALAYRQAIAAHKLVEGPGGKPLLFSKESSSGACMATVDVTYPSCPMFLLFNPELLKALMEPVFQYSESSLWPHDFAPHDVGLYPLANGQAYGGGPDNLAMQMPVEESGNMLIMTAALCDVDGNARYAARHWDELTAWARYLSSKGLDPENQLCTDDFAGHLAHNTNLSIKAILAVACYSKMAAQLGKDDIAREFRAMAEDMARQWKEMAADGGHYRLAFDQPGSWSMKYNLVWDRLLDLNLFDEDITRTELASYPARTNAYGLPLDNRKTYTKGDWMVWTASLHETKAGFQQTIAPLWKFLNESPDRVAFGDWHDTVTGRVTVFRARSVVGGVFIKMMMDESLYGKWSRRAAAK